jgi:hypothetical protein
MKRLAFLSIAFLFAFSVANGQIQKTDHSGQKGPNKEQKTTMVPLKKLEGNVVSEMSKNSFEEDFGKIPNVKWERLGPFDVATFTRNGKEIVANFDINGKLVGTTQSATLEQLPASAKKEIKRDYRGYKIVNIIFYKDNESNDTDMVLYGVQFEDADNYFVEMTKGTDKIVLKVSPLGEVTFFKHR